MDSQQHKSRAKLFVVIGSIITIVIVAGAAYALYLAATTMPQETPQQSGQDSTSQEAPVTEQSLKQDLTDLDDSITEQKAAHDAAKNTVNEKQVKVAN